MDIDITSELAAMQSQTLDDASKSKVPVYNNTTTHLTQIVPTLITATVQSAQLIAGQQPTVQPSRAAQAHALLPSTVHSIPVQSAACQLGPNQLNAVMICHSASTLPTYSQSCASGSRRQQVSKAIKSIGSDRQVAHSESEALDSATLSTSFDDSKTWCEDCQKLVDGDCQRHPVRVIEDRFIPSFAIQTLPACFLLSVSVEGGYSVVCKKLVKPRARFGPLLGKRVESHANERASTPEDRLFKVFTSKSDFHYLDISDEQSSNWMMFIRRAKTSAEENAIAYQHNGSIYFLTTKRLIPGDELKVGFSLSYSNLVGSTAYASPAAATSEPVKEKSVIIKDGYPCDTCEAEFTQFEELQKHDCVADSEAVVSKPRRTRNRRKGKPQKLGFQPEKLSSNHLSSSSVRKDRKERKLNTKHKSFSSVQVVKCSSCDSVFNTRRRLAIHMHVHTGEYPYKCEQLPCSKSFNTKFKLDRHRLTHGARDYTCTQCGKGFSRRDNLQAHLIIHDDNRQVHKCDYNGCAKRYNCVASFKVHTALHQIEGHMVTTCPLCHQVYEEKEKLVKHIKLHAGSKTARAPVEKKHPCLICEKSFSANKDKQRHMLTHTKEKHFECHLCSLKFGRADHLKRHLTRVHPGGEKDPKSRSARTSKKADALADLTSTELTKSIQQLLADNSLGMDPVGATPLILPENSLGGSSVQITSYSTTSAHHRQVQASFEHIPSSSNTLQRVSNNYTMGNGHQSEPTFSHYLKPINSTSWQPLIGQESIKLSQPTMIIVPEGQHPITSIDQLQKPSSGLLDTSQILSTDNLCTDYTTDTFKVLNNLTPILLNNDGNSNDVDFLPVVYQQNLNNVSTNQ